MTYSEKYMAGLLDADGYIGIRCRIGARPDLDVQIMQRAKYSDICDAFKEFGGHVISKYDGKYIGISMRTKHARMCLERLKGFMVVKRQLSTDFIKLVDEADVLKSAEEVLAFRAKAKSIKWQPQTFMPNYPSRKWLAGYFDGDGSFNVKVCKKTGYAYPTAAVLSEPRYSNGILLLQKAFGGNICTLADGNLLWQLQLSQPSKTTEFLEHFAKHLVEKRAQAYFLLGCASNGNFRDGNAIRETIKSLNTQQHRLSDPAGEAAKLVRDIRFNIEKKKVGRPLKRQSSQLELTA